jgi:3-hydroxyisobutyrate dehydrogenase
MVPTSRHVREVYLGQEDVLGAVKHLDKKKIGETICMDESTIEQVQSKSVALEMKSAGADMLEAPVSGG